MKIRTHHAVSAQQYLTAYGLDPDRVIYFDIETTGFRASTSSLYMIGWAVSATSLCPEDLEMAHGPQCRDLCSADHFPEDVPEEGTFHGKADNTQDKGLLPARTDQTGGEWIVTQVLSQSYAEEVLLLKQFADVLSAYDTIIEFNGDRFDLPYMREKYAVYGMEDPFERLRTVDLYQMIRPFKNALGLTRLNQKSVEQFLMIHREDPYNGGELIDVYRSVRDHCCADEEAALDALFLHNYEDVLGMLDMTPLLSYTMAMESSALVSAEMLERENLDEPDLFGRDDCSEDLPILRASFPLDVPVPRPLNVSFDNCCEIRVSRQTATVTIRALTDCLFHFFPDYRNYYYLPDEDMAIHKSVASFVDPSHRERATAQNCYVKKDGVFIPLAGDRDEPVFMRRYKDPVLWFEFRQEMLEDAESFSYYIHSLMRSCALHPRHAHPEDNSDLSGD